MVIVSRSYNGCDPGANLEIPKKLRDMGVLPITMDFLPLDAVSVSAQWPNMYWRYGQKILSAAEIVANDPRLTAMYLTNFGCGPDSFVARFFKQRMGDKPYLQIEVDEHSADAGIITRCEAFLDSLEQGAEKRDKAAPWKFKTLNIDKDNKRTVLIPRMADHAYGAKLAREAEICYVTMALVTDYDCWHDAHESVTVDMIVGNLIQNSKNAQALIVQTIEDLADKPGCGCGEALKIALITDRSAIPAETISRIRHIVGRYLSQPQA